VKDTDQNKSERCLEIIQGAIKSHIQDGSKEREDLGLIIDGTTLDFALKDHPDKFYEVRGKFSDFKLFSWPAIVPV
jgi:hypothetical protein